MTTDREANWVENVGKPAADSLREMVAALECDYDRLEELKDSLGDRFDELPEPDEGMENLGFLHYLADLVAQGDEDAVELKELEEAAGECDDADDARERIQEDALSVQVRSGWVTPGDDMTAEEFEILLTTGGPAVRILGELDEHGEPYRAWLEVQDWGKPWTHYYESGLDEVCLAYARCFCFAS